MLLALTLLFAGPLTLQAETSPSAPADPGDLASHLSVLAGEGDQTLGSKHREEVGAYLGRALAAAGAEPAGTDGYFLEIPLTHTKHNTQPRVVITTDRGSAVRGSSGIDFEVQIQGKFESTGPLPILRVREQADLPSEPDPGKALVLIGYPKDTRQWILNRGGAYRDGWGLYLLPVMGPQPKVEALEWETYELGREDEVDKSERLLLRGDLRRYVRAGGQTIELIFDAETKSVGERAVVAKLSGKGTAERPELAEEAIVLAAHGDRFGAALDDASGTAMVLALMKRLADEGPHARTIVALLNAGDRSGNWGANYYKRSETVPLERTVAYLNLFRVGLPDERAGGSGGLWMTGIGRSGLAPGWKEAGVEVVEDPYPSKRFGRRFDEFLRKDGVVAHTLSSYDLDKERRASEAGLDEEHLELVLDRLVTGVRALANADVNP